MSPAKPLWPRDKAYEWVKLHKVVAIIRTRNAAQARGTIEALIKGGFKLIEVAMTMMGATDVIREFSGRSGILVGAGSVLSVKMAQTAMDAGAQFIMTPHTDPDVLKLTKKAKQLYLCGALTPTEVVKAWTLGADMIRLFPARSLGGAPYVQALKELLQEVPLVPSGGITLDNLRDYFLAGATAVGAAGALMNEQVVENGRWPEITAQAKRFQETLQRL
jgi:2-dehydro-3-deoxyphosphogluconate aldolase/(4S)-4-hydroxy-2-oxoglutarate aldolase